MLKDRNTQEEIIPRKGDLIEYSLENRTLMYHQPGSSVAWSSGNDKILLDGNPDKSTILNIGIVIGAMHGLQAIVTPSKRNAHPEEFIAVEFL